jgi:protein-disulfide isomerase
MRIFLFFAFLMTYAAATAAIARAAQCNAPSGQKIEFVSAYLTKRFHIPSEQKLDLVESSKANDSCFWKLHFETEASKRELVMYLSPDRRYLTSNFYDISVDPSKEDAQHKRELMASLTAGNPPSAGSQRAPVTIVEFVDFECSYCKQLAGALSAEILNGEEKGVRVIVRQFPLSSHAWARDAALVSQCAAIQKNDFFWQVHDFIFENQNSLRTSNLFGQVENFVTTKTSIDIPRWKQCVKKVGGLKSVDGDLELGRKNGVHRTPTMFINGEMVVGFENIDQLREMISRAAQGQPVRRNLALSLPETFADQSLGQP